MDLVIYHNSREYRLWIEKRLFREGFRPKQGYTLTLQMRDHDPVHGILSCRGLSELLSKDRRSKKGDRFSYPITVEEYESLRTSVDRVNSGCIVEPEKKPSVLPVFTVSYSPAPVMKLASRKARTNGLQQANGGGRTMEIEIDYERLVGSSFGELNRILACCDPVKSFINSLSRKDLDAIEDGERVTMKMPISAKSTGTTKAKKRIRDCLDILEIYGMDLQLRLETRQRDSVDAFKTNRYADFGDSVERFKRQADNYTKLRRLLRERREEVIASLQNNPGLAAKLRYLTPNEVEELLAVFAK